MPSKYYKAISEVKASEELKQRIIENLKQEELEKEEPKVNYAKRGGMIVKFRKIATAIGATLGVVLCSGVVYATLGGIIAGKPALEWLGISFSDDYIEYVEPVENQRLEKDGNIVELQSTVTNEGFVVLQFAITLSDEEKQFADETCGLEYLSFNDKEDELAGANYNLIIDGAKIWVRGASNQEVREITANKEYVVNQLWFLSDNDLKGKEEFTITLNDVMLNVGEKLIKMDGSFEVEASKQKALENTTIIVAKDSTLNYKQMAKNMEKVLITPIQTVIKLSTKYENITEKSLRYLLDENYIGDMSYKVYDQNGNELTEYDLETKVEATYLDGTIKEFEPGDGIEYANIKTLSVDEYIVTEKNNDITELNVEVFETNEYYGTTKKIGVYKINLKTQNIKVENKDELVYTDPEASVNDYVSNTSIAEITEFEIVKPANFNEADYVIKRFSTENSEIEDEEVLELKIENAGISYEFSQKSSGECFKITRYEEKDVYLEEFIPGTEEVEPIVLDENDEYQLVFTVSSQQMYDEVKEMIDTIKLK